MRNGAPSSAARQRSSRQPIALHRVKRRIAQSLTSGALVGRRGSSRLRSALIAHGDPSVEFELDGTKLQLPLSHQLPQTRRRFHNYAENLGELARPLADMGHRIMVDVGANIGDSAAIVKAHAPEMAMLCVEGDDRFVPFLRANTARWSDVTRRPGVARRAHRTVAGSHG